jgi:hypothetical protein
MFVFVKRVPADVCNATDADVFITEAMATIDVAPLLLGL